MENAIEELSKLLKHPTDIEDKLDNIENNINNRISTHRQTILKDYNERYSNLANIKNTNFHALENILVIDYHQDDRIKIISKAYQNLNLIYYYSNMLKNLNNEIPKDYSTEYFEKENKNILYPTYEKYNELKDLRLRLRLESTESRKIEVFELEFEMFILKIDLLEADPNLLDIVIKEEEKDLISRLIKNVYIEDKQTAESKNEGKISRNIPDIENYKKQLVFNNEHLMNSYNNEYITELKKIYSHYNNRPILNLQSKLISNLQSRLNEIVKYDYFSILEELNKIFSNDNIFDNNKIVLYIHKLLKSTFSSTNYEDVRTIISVLEFNAEYLLILDSNFMNFDSIIDNKYLSDRYIEISIGNFEFLITNLKNKIIDNFLSREKMPAIDENNRFISLDFINIMELINNQIEPIQFESKISKRLCIVICKTIEDMIIGIKEVVESDYADSVNLKSRPGYEEYVIMIANSALKLAQYSEDVSHLFVDLLKFTNDILSEFVVKTLTPVFTSLDIDQRLFVTLSDFLDDYKIRMEDYTFYTFNCTLIRDLNKRYMKLLNKKKFDNDSLLAKLKNDAEKLDTFFKKYTQDPNFEVIRDIIPLLETSSVELFVIETKTFKIKFPDLKKDFVKNIIQRKKISEKDKHDMKERIRDLFLSDVHEKKPSFFGKLFKGFA